MEEKDIKYFENKLIEEKDKLVSELETVGRKNPDNPSDWEATPGDMNEHEIDLNNLADNMEEYETRTAILKQLEIQLGDVNRALKKIEENKYGICEVSGEVIEKERLEANSAARTCTVHMNQEVELGL